LIPSVEDGHEQACPLFAGPKRVLWVTSEPAAGHVKDEVSGIGNGPPLQVSDDEPEATRVLPCFGQTTTSGMSGVSQPKGQPQATRSRKAGRQGRTKRETCGGDGGMDWKAVGRPGIDLAGVAGVTAGA
jgi:hypothetical protein